MRQIVGSVLKWLAVVMCALLIIAGALWFRPAWTPTIRAPRGTASLEQVELNGSRQWLLIRGQDRDQPLVLFLHGGPGMPAMYLAHASTRELERDFVVVHWDRHFAQAMRQVRDVPCVAARSARH